MHIRRTNRNFIMSTKPVTLLVCLSPSVAPETITEQSFFSIVNVIAPVQNIKIIARDGQMKAFVEVPNTVAAQCVIDKLHCKLLNVGKVKVFVSNKNHINYTQTLQQLLCVASEVSDGSFSGLRPSITNAPVFAGKYGTTNKKSEQKNSQKFNTPVHSKSQLKKIESKETYDVGSSNVSPLIDSGAKGMVRDTRCISHVLNLGSEHNSNWAIKVTHIDPECLVAKKVTKIFRRFGKVRNMEFDAQDSSWTIEYAIEKEARKAALAAHNNKLFGYKLTIVPEFLLFTLDELISNSFGESSDECMRNSKDKLPYNSDASTHTLRIDSSMRRISLAELCTYVAGIHVPVKIAEAFDFINNRNFFFVDFVSYDEAHNVFNAINASNNPKLGLTVNFMC